MKKIIVLAAILTIVGCTDPKNAERTLKGAGYSDIEITGLSFFSCGKGDAYMTGFTAKGPTGIPVEGAVCAGIFKNSTIRSN